MTYKHHEYSRPSVTSNGCSYSTLSSYNANYSGRGPIVGAPTMSRARSNEIVVVPSYGGPGYQNLTQQRNSTCTGYYPVSSAYPAYPNACGQFSSRLCG